MKKLANRRWTLIFFVRRARSNRRCECKTMIDRTYDLSVVRQVQLLDLSRSSVYYLPQPLPDNGLRLVGELNLASPFAGAHAA